MKDNIPFPEMVGPTLAALAEMEPGSLYVTFVCNACGGRKEFTMQPGSEAVWRRMLANMAGALEDIRRLFYESAASAGWTWGRGPDGSTLDCCPECNREGGPDA